jgi:hypothetical protein
MTPLVTGWSSPRRDIEPPTRPPHKTSLLHTQRNCLEIERFSDIRQGGFRARFQLLYCVVSSLDTIVTKPGPKPRYRNTEDVAEPGYAGTCGDAGGEAGYPKAWVVTIGEGASHAAVAAVSGPVTSKGSGEQSLARRLYPRLEDDWLLIAVAQLAEPLDHSGRPAPGQQPAAVIQDQSAVQPRAGRCGSLVPCTSAAIQ